MIDRRTLLIGSLGMVTGPLLANAQAPAKVFRIGVLGGSTPTSVESRHIWQGFFHGLRDLGYVEGHNVVIEGRYYGDNLDQLPALATELVRLQVDVILAGAPPAPEAAKRATSTIPIVMANHSDPVGSGLVASLARPGGNVTGLSMLSPEMRVKQLQLLKEILPRLTRVAFLRNPDIPLDSGELEVMARSLGVRAQVVQARSPNEIAEAFAAAARERAEALSVLAGTMFFAHRALIAELALKSRLPTVSLLRSTPRRVAC